MKSCFMKILNHAMLNNNTNPLLSSKYILKAIKLLLEDIKGMIIIIDLKNISNLECKKICK